MTKELQDMSRAEKLISVLNIDNKNEILEYLKETVQAYKNDMPDADRKFNYLIEQLKLNIDEQAKAEFKNRLLLNIKYAAGYHLSEDYLWNTDTKLAPLTPSLKETIVSGDFEGKDSNRVGSIYTRTKDSQGIVHRKPKPKPQDADEKEIEDKLQALLKLFNSRNKTKITMTALKSILSDSSIEERSSIKQKLSAASALIQDDKSCQDDLIQYYFTDGKILNEDSASGTSSSTSWQNWNSVEKVVYIDAKTGRCKFSNSFLARVAERIDKQKLEYLLSKGIKCIQIETDGTETEIQINPEWLK